MMPTAISEASVETPRPANQEAFWLTIGTTSSCP